MGALVTASLVLLDVVRWGGAVFLFGYAFCAARRAWQGGSSLKISGGAVESAGAVLSACLAFTFLNPHVYLDTVVLLGSLSAQQAALWGFAAGAMAASVVLNFSQNLIANS